MTTPVISKFDPLDIIHSCLYADCCRFLKQCLANKAVTMSDYTIALLCNACTYCFHNLISLVYQKQLFPSVSFDTFGFSYFLIISSNSQHDCYFLNVV